MIRFSFYYLVINLKKTTFKKNLYFRKIKKKHTHTQNKKYYKSKSRNSNKNDRE